MSQGVFICISSQPYQGVNIYIVNVLRLPTANELAVRECSGNGVNALSKWPQLGDQNRRESPE